MGVIELQTVQVELDGGPGVRADQVGEIVGELRFAQGVNLVIEIGTHPANGMGIGIDGIGLQAFEFQVLQVGLVLLIK